MSVEAGQRAAGYLRVSQERNARAGYGLDAQEADVRRFAVYRRLALVKVYREEGASGYERERPELARLIADAKAGKWDVAVFPAVDRAGRSVKDVIEIDRTLRECGVEVVFVREGVDTTTALRPCAFAFLKSASVMTASCWPSTQPPPAFDLPV
ncbi:MAG: recombinase family protein [Planctomycetota bacterium]|jgi:site-specific DNA recombinase